ncbi:hypothetical protein JOD43_001488 [Pullulanibacillus pueri]|uniref:Pilus assembly protein n=1 Tax=Pullulanibacillus pueri TaxID=1437324 RepID=A0A8J2ZTL1_9BACL|nr:hypothetical protein [Pullulanibacillus pueri]MBM7681321.1 hypothetical protein [Pullulanibacillus pueri]GGH77599.1 hypothetical protein GCM10007096_09730 [Pullulanibacillus pueri]
MVAFLNQLRKKESGSFTIEASLLFPILLILTICLLLLSIVVYQKAVLQQRAGLIANRVAYVWNNSQKNIDGDFRTYTTDDRGDGLYWRMADDQFLSQFGISIFSGHHSEVTIGSSGGGLIGKKLGKASKALLPPGSTGTISYNNSVFSRDITVKLEEPLHFPGSAKKLFGIDFVRANSSASVTEPTEFIRTTDLLITYFKELQENFNLIDRFRKKK